MSNIWFTSDTHGYHKNIAGPKVSDWSSGYRNFDNQYIMTDHIIEQINKYVKPDDILYHLGDWTFGGIDKIYKFRKQINCKNIHLILGNHDQHIKVSDFWKGIGEARNFSSVQDVLTVKFPSTSIFMSHYAHRVWDKSHHNRIHLYGHSHASIDDTWGKSMDVGIDNAYKILGEYRPFNLTEILDIMKTREIKIIDHHNSETHE